MSYKSAIKKVNSAYDQHLSDEILRLDRELINLSRNLTLDDWRKIRKGNYWEVLDSISDEVKKKQFTLSKVRAYKNQL